jgi:hypothetical protein
MKLKCSRYDKTKRIYVYKKFKGENRMKGCLNFFKERTTSSSKVEPKGKIYHAKDVACYVVSYGIEKGLNLIHRQVQTILYFTQIEWLLEKGYPCFHEEIERWKLGATVKNVHQTLCIFGSDPIHFIPSEWKQPIEIFLPKVYGGERRLVDMTAKLLLIEDADWIRFITEKISNWDLNTIIHYFRQHPLWKPYETLLWEEREKAPVYTHDELIEYYSQHPEERVLTQELSE